MRRQVVPLQAGCSRSHGNILAIGGVDLRGTDFLYRVKQGRPALCVGGLKTAQGLALFDPAASVEITRFGATSYEHHGWATEKELPAFASVEELRQFLEVEGAELGLIDFEVKVDGGVSQLSTHDDGECHFIFADQGSLVATLKRVVPVEYEGLVIDALLKNPGMYITCSDAGILRKYASFDAYLEAEGGTEADGG